jgi:hypothetical protein
MLHYSTHTTAKKKQFGRRWRPCHLRHPQRILHEHECSRQQSRWAVAEKVLVCRPTFGFFFPAFPKRGTLSLLSGLPRPYRAIRSFVNAFWMWRSVRVKPIDRALLCFPPTPFFFLLSLVLRLMKTDAENTVGRVRGSARQRTK